MPYALIEFIRPNQDAHRFVPGGVAVQGGEVRYSPDFPEEGAELEHTLAELRRFYGVDGAPPPDGGRYGPEGFDTWDKLFAKMDRAGNNGYHFMRYAVPVPEDATLDEIYEHYIVRRETGLLGAPETPG